MSLLFNINNINPGLLYSRNPYSDIAYETQTAKSAVDDLREAANYGHYERSIEDDGSCPRPQKTFLVNLNQEGLPKKIIIEVCNPDEVIKLRVTIVDSDSSRTYRISHSDVQKRICEAFKKITVLLDGKSYEYQVHIPPEHLPDACWGENWKLSPAGQAYRGIVYPHLQGYIHHILKGKNNRVLEICSGDGELAESLFERFGGQIGKYYLAEYNKESLQKAGAALQPQVESGQAVLKRADIVEADYSDLTENAQVDLAFGCGALNHHVVHCKECALIALGKLISVLRAGGTLILCGKSPSFLTAQDLEERGLKVKNISLPYPRYYFPFLVATKEVQAPIELPAKPAERV